MSEMGYMKYLIYRVGLLLKKLEIDLWNVYLFICSSRSYYKIDLKEILCQTRAADIFGNVLYCSIIIVFHWNFLK